jgi:hypothetical protein
LLGHDLLRFLFEERAFHLQLTRQRDERNHDLGLYDDAVFLARARSLEDGANLHLGQLRQVNAESNAAQTEHRVLLTQKLNGRKHVLLDVEFVLKRLDVSVAQLDAGFQDRDFTKQLVVAGQKLVQRRINEPNRHRQPVHDAEQSVEVAALERQQLAEWLGSLCVAAGQDHRLNVRQSL